MSRISDLGEFGFLDKLLTTLRRSDERIHVAPGDDACVIDLSSGGPVVLTTDMLIEGIHFRLDWQEPEELGYKAVAVNLSDVAAMGARPGWILVSLGCPRETEEGFLDALYRGMLGLCDESRVVIAGGDTTRAEKLTLSLTAAGLCEEGSPVTIAGARSGETIYATACPGLSGLGLRLLKKFGRSGAPARYEQALRAHLRPEVPWREAPEIARLVRPGAMTDLSDGLARDVGKICQASRLGARIDFRSLSWHKDLQRAWEEFGWDPVSLALGGGEDYCLVFTADPARLEQGRRQSESLAALPLLELGTITAREKGFVAVGPDGTERPVDPKGFDHFSL